MCFLWDKNTYKGDSFISRYFLKISSEMISSFFVCVCKRFWLVETVKLVKPNYLKDKEPAKELTLDDVPTSMFFNAFTILVRMFNFVNKCFFLLSVFSFHFFLRDFIP